MIFTRKPTIHSALRTSPLAATVPYAELATLDRLATTIPVPAGTEIVEADRVGRECFVVIDGQFDVDLGDHTIRVGPGDVIGELALITHQPRTASVIAATDSSVYVLTRAEFSTLLDECPKLARHILDGAVRRAAAN